MLRVPLFSVDEAARMVADEDVADPIATMAVSLAAGPYVRDAAVSGDQRARDTLARYLARMGGRATPYGLFAGTAPVSVGEERDLALGPRDRHRVRVRVDVQALEEAVRAAADAVGPLQWPLRTNPIARADGDVLRFAKSGDASADVVSMRLTPAIAAVLRVLGDGEVIGADIVAALRADNPGFSEDQMAGFLTRLVDGGLIERSLGLIEPGVEPAERAVDLLEAMGATEQADALRTLLADATGVRPLDPALTGTLDAGWRAAASHIPSFAEVKQAQRFDVHPEMDMSAATLDRRSSDDLQRAILRVAALQNGGGAAGGSAFSIDEFRDAFRARYEDAEVPLLSALDLESGVLRSWHRSVSELAVNAGVRAPEESSLPRVNPELLKLYDRWTRDGTPVDIPTDANANERAKASTPNGRRPESVGGTASKERERAENTDANANERAKASTPNGRRPEGVGGTASEERERAENTDANANERAKASTPNGRRPHSVGGTASKEHERAENTDANANERAKASTPNGRRPHSVGGTASEEHERANDTPAASTTGARAALAVLLGDHPEGLHSMLVGGVGRAPHALLARFSLNRDGMRQRLSDAVHGAEEMVGDAVAAGAPSDAPGVFGPGVPTGPNATADADTAGAPDTAPIHAELVYHPGGRIGNVLIRPRLLDDTIALTGASGGTLALDRLLIQLRGDEFRLRDSLTGRPVLVELNTAHNVDFHGLDPVYAVLGHLASSGGVGWSWGALAHLSHLPRVTCGPVVVAPEQWRLARADIRDVLHDPDPAGHLRRLLPGLGDRRWVGVGDYDHVLPIDLRSARSVGAALAKEAKGPDTASVKIIEMPQLEAPAVRGPSGGHVAEAVIPFSPVHRTPPRPGTGADAFDADRGRAWVYFSYFCGQASADAVVTRAKQLADELHRSGAVTDWFFLRYTDGGYHVRVRMRPIDGAARAHVVAAMDALGGALRAEGLIGRSVMDDYIPEVSRYGGADNLAAAERLFTASSDQVAAFLAARPTEELRLYQAVADAVGWCSALFDSTDEQRAFLRLCQSGTSLSFTKKGNPLGKFHRAHDRALRDHLADAQGDEQVAKALAALSSSVRQTLTGRRGWSVFGSALHLHCNRLFAFDAVRLEYLAYELAERRIHQLQALDGVGGKA